MLEAGFVTYPREADMALVNCPECNKEISDRASSCPACGYPIQQISYFNAVKEEMLPAMNICNRCGSEFNVSLAACPDCQSDVFEPVAATKVNGVKIPTAERNELYGIMLLFIPVLAASLCYFWVGQMTLLDSPMPKLGMIGVLTVLFTALLACFETNKYGYDNPIFEFIGFLLMWIIAYPYYLYKRKSYGLTNLSMLGALVVLIYVSVFFLVYSETSKRLSEIGILN